MAVPKAPRTTVGKKRDSKGQLRDYDKENEYRRKNQAANTRRKKDVRLYEKKNGKIPAGMELDHVTKGRKKLGPKTPAKLTIKTQSDNRKQKHQKATKGRTRRV